MLRTLARAALAGRPPLPRAAAARLYAAPPGSTLAEGAETEEDEFSPAEEVRFEPGEPTFMTKLTFSEEGVKAMIESEIDREKVRAQRRERHSRRRDSPPRALPRRRRPPRGDERGGDDALMMTRRRESVDDVARTPARRTIVDAPSPSLIARSRPLMLSPHLHLLPPPSSRHLIASRVQSAAKIIGLLGGRLESYHVTTTGCANAVMVYKFPKNHDVQTLLYTLMASGSYKEQETTKLMRWSDAARSLRVSRNLYQSGGVSCKIEK
jgi:hypothetical protein